MSPAKKFENPCITTLTKFINKRSLTFLHFWKLSTFLWRFFRRNWKSKTVMKVREHFFKRQITFTHFRQWLVVNVCNFRVKTSFLFSMTIFETFRSKFYFWKLFVYILYYAEFFFSFHSLNLVNCPSNNWDVQLGLSTLPWKLYIFSNEVFTKSLTPSPLYFIRPTRITCQAFSKTVEIVRVGLEI